MMEYIEATIKLGIPMVIMSWWVYSWLYRKGHIKVDATRKEAETQLKVQRDAAKAAKKQQAQESNGGEQELAAAKEPEDFWLEKWMWFGGGFYGLAALWTLLVLEAIEIVQFAIGFPEFVSQFVGGPIDVAISFLINQMQNLFAAFAWVIYWDNGFSLIWFAIAYFGYLAGMQLAKRFDAKDVLRERILTR